MESTDSIVAATGAIGISGLLVSPAGSLSVLASERRGAAAVSRDSCANRGNRPRSNLVDAGRGGVTQDPDAMLPALYIAGHDFRTGASAGPPLISGLHTGLGSAWGCH